MTHAKPITVSFLDSEVIASGSFVMPPKIRAASLIMEDAKFLIEFVDGNELNNAVSVENDVVKIRITGDSRLFGPYTIYFDNLGSIDGNVVTLSLSVSIIGNQKVRLVAYTFSLKGPLG